MVIYNKGKRSFEINAGTEKKPDIKKLDPGKTLEVTDAMGKKLVKKYHRDLVDHENMSPGKKSKLEKIVEDQRKENGTLAARVKELEAAGGDKELKEKVTTLEESVKASEDALKAKGEEIEGLKATIEKKDAENKALADKLEALSKENKELKEAAAPKEG